MRLGASHMRNGSEYKCRFGTRRVVVSARMDFGARRLTCIIPPQAECEERGVPPGSSLVEISMNGQQYSPHVTGYAYHEPPTVSHLSPAAGPHHGGIRVTITGRSFVQEELASGTDLSSTSCRFGEVVVPAVPYWPNATNASGNASGNVSTHGIANASAYGRQGSYAEWSNQSANPANGSANGSANGLANGAANGSLADLSNQLWSSLSGAGSSHGLSWQAPPPMTPYLECISPARSVGAFPLEVTFNGQACFLLKLRSSPHTRNAILPELSHLTRAQPS